MSSESASSRKRSISAILSVTLAPPRTTTNGRSGASTIRLQRDDLALEQQPGRRREQLGHPGGGGVRAVGRAEGVVHVGVGQPGQLLGQVGVVLRLAALPARVLEHQDAARLQPLGAAPDLRADHVGRLVDGSVDQLRQPVRGRLERGLGVTALGPPQVGAQDQPRPALQQQLDRGHRGPDPAVVGHPAVVQRHVEVDAHEHPVPLRNRQVADTSLAELSLPGLHLLHVPRRPPRRRAPAGSAPPRGWSSPTRCRTTPPPSPAARR